ncbi:MAG: hypothetical protein HYU53_05175 [Acidobacteria bacterium]|nr:hypothetical protein [Acidobacteriota bacterium]
MNASVALESRSPIGPAKSWSRAAGKGTAGGAGRRALRRIVGLLDDAVFLLLAVLLIPAAILLVGTPVALSVGVLLEIGQGVFLGLLTTAAPVIVAITAALFLARYLSRR